MGRKIIDKQDGTLEDDIRYDCDKMKWSENTIREEVTDRDRCEEGVEEGKRDALIEERRRVQERPVSKLLRDNGHSAQRRCRKKSPKLVARGLVSYIGI